MCGIGATKLYRVAALSDRGRRALLKRSRASELAGMNQKDFVALTASYVGKRRKVTDDMLAHGFRMKVQAWCDALRGFEPGSIRSAEIRKGIDDDLRVLRRLAAEVKKRI